MNLAVVVPTFRRPDLLRRCLAALERHAPPGTDVLVVDDASPDPAIRETVTAFPQVRYLRRSRCGGFAAAVNAGIRATSAPFLELLNDDTEVEAGWAEAALGRFADPRVGAVAPLVLMPDGRIDSAGDGWHPGGFARKRGHRRRPAGDLLVPCRVDGVSGAAGFFRRAALEEVGLFPESFGSYFEDVDLSCRLRRGGWHLHYEPASRVLHHVGASHGRGDRRLVERQSLNEERLFWRNVPPGDWWWALPLHAGVLAGKALLRLQEGNFWPFLWGRLRILSQGLSSGS